MIMMEFLRVLVLLFVGIGISSSSRACAEVPQNIMRKIDRVNEEGPYLGIVVPNAFEMNPLLQSPSFAAHAQLPYLDFSGKFFTALGKSLNFLRSKFKEFSKLPSSNSKLLRVSNNINSGLFFNQLVSVSGVI